MIISLIRNQIQQYFYNSQKLDHEYRCTHFSSRMDSGNCYIDYLILIVYHIEV